MIETRQHSVQSFTSCICLSSAIRHSSTPLKNVLEKKGVCIVAGVKKRAKERGWYFVHITTSKSRTLENLAAFASTGGTHPKERAQHHIGL